MKGQKGYVLVNHSPRYGVHLGACVMAAWRQLKRWYELAEQRRHLASLSDEALKDIGLSRADILPETERPFWDDPLAK